MISYCTDYSVVMPDVTIYMNCDTVLAINLRKFNLSEHDELVFTIKNYSYVGSSYAFMFRAKKTDADENGEVIFKVPSTAAMHIKQGAFYNIGVLAEAFSTKDQTVYKMATDNGRIVLKYGAQDLTVKSDSSTIDYEITGMRLEPLDLPSIDTGAVYGEIVGMRLEPI